MRGHLVEGSATVIKDWRHVVDDQAGLDSGPGEADSRRKFLRRAAVAGTGIWAAPMILSLDASSAAAMTSPPPAVVPTDLTPPNTIQSVQTTPPVQAAPAIQVKTQQLPRTGADIDKMTAAGLTALGGGGALLWWSNEVEQRLADPAVVTDTE